MKGAYSFTVTIQSSPEDTGRVDVDVRCALMNTKNRGYVTNSSWTCDLGNGDEVIENSLIAACKWFRTCIEQKERKLNNAVASDGNGK